MGKQHGLTRLPLFLTRLRLPCCMSCAGSLEERGHAELMMEYQNKRGGRVVLKNILMPEMEFNNDAKGEAL